MTATGVLKYLLVEDDDSHAMIIQRTLERDEVPCHVERVSNGVEAMHYLRKEGPYAATERPDVVLLDLNLPRLNGHEVLVIVKKDPDLAGIPIVVLSTSDTETDRSKAYGNAANSYLVKPTSFDQFREMVRVLNRYWGVWNRPERATLKGH